MSAHMGELQMGETGDMLIDDYDPVDEKPDVAIITPEGSTDEADTEPRADDCTYYLAFSSMRLSELICI